MVKVIDFRNQLIDMSDDVKKNIKKFLKMSLSYEQILFFYFIMVRGDPTTSEFKNYIRHCKDLYKGSANKKQYNNEDVGISREIGKCILEQGTSRDYFTKSIPQLLDVIINSANFPSTFSEILSSLHDDDDFVDGLNREFKAYVLKKDKEYGVFNSQCNLKLTDEDYFNTEGTKENRNATKSPSLHNIGLSNYCPPLHRKSKQLRYDDDGKEIVVNENEECCVIDTKAKVKRGLTKVIAAKAFAGLHWTKEGLEKYVEEYNNQLLLDEQNIENDIKAVNSQIQNSTDVSTNWRLKKQKGKLEKELKTIQKIEVKDRNTELKAWEFAQLEYSSFQASRVGKKDINFIDDMVGSIVYRLEIFMKKTAYTDGLFDHSSEGFFAVVPKVFSWRNLTNQMINFLIWVLKNPQFTIILTTLLEEKKRDMCDEISLELYGPTKNKTFGVNAMLNDIEYTYNMSSKFILSIISTNDLNRMKATFKDMLKCVATITEGIPILSTVLNILDMSVDWMWPRVKQIISIYVWKEIYTSGFKGIIDLLDFRNCIRMDHTKRDHKTGNLRGTDTSDNNGRYWWSQPFMEAFRGLERRNKNNVINNNNNSGEKNENDEAEESKSQPRDESIMPWEQSAHNTTPTTVRENVHEIPTMLDSGNGPNTTPVTRPVDDSYKTGPPTMLNSGNGPNTTPVNGGKRKRTYKNKKSPRTRSSLKRNNKL